MTARKQYKNLYRACVVCLLESLLFNDKAIFNGGVSCEHIRFLAFVSTPIMEGAGMLVVSLKGVNFGFWSRLGCSGQNANILSCQGLV